MRGNLNGGRLACSEVKHAGCLVGTGTDHLGSILKRKKKMSVKVHKIWVDRDTIWMQAYRRPTAVQNRSFMLEKRLPFTLALVVDFVNADFLIPRGHGEVVASRRETEIRDAILGGLVQSDILGDITRGVCRARRGSGAAADIEK
jgi:hypothetical protein